MNENTLLNYIKNLKDTITVSFKPNTSTIFNVGVIMGQQISFIEQLKFKNNTFDSPSFFVDLLGLMDVAVYKIDNSNIVYISTQFVTTCIDPDKANKFELNYIDLPDTYPKKHNQILQINGLKITLETYDDEFYGFEKVINHIEQLIGLKYSFLNTVNDDEKSPNDNKYYKYGKYKTNLNINAIWDEIEVWLSKNAKTTFNELMPGITHDELSKIEHTLLYKLPTEVKEIYLRHNGNTSFGYYEFVSLQKAIQIRNEQLKNINNLYLNPKLHTHTGVQNLKWHEAWLPVLVCKDFTSMIMIDLEPTIKGCYGQLLFWSKREGEGVTPYGLDSLAFWFDDYNEKLKYSFKADENGRVKEIPFDPYDGTSVDYIDLEDI